MSDKQRASALDFATRTVFAESAPDPECLNTIRELRAAFGDAAVLRAVAQLGIARREAPADEVMQVLRGFCLLILESDRPRLTATLVGKLVKLDLATGRPIHMRQLGAANGISKQAVSNRLKTYADRLNLPRPDSLPANRVSHRLMNRRNYGNHRDPINPAA